MDILSVLAIFAILSNLTLSLWVRSPKTSSAIINQLLIRRQNAAPIAKLNPNNVHLSLERLYV
ncbi:hypothetical protein [Microcoleus sp. bin38.metabat.b11b12b14.051]|uniref:hypothetical protein n=1 Tax=Microcoleus sp. bin38.metabat.b11b12b14.051 TaxID=2742709 RepID=UPI0025F03B49|nr:hypothetical protein [Microcoleus sp. bin38.metabat.b11b12b14.051]